MPDPANWPVGQSFYLYVWIGQPKVRVRYTLVRYRTLRAASHTHSPGISSFSRRERRIPEPQTYGE
ncbi:protein of unknown function [Pseudomonas mediterranea]